MTSKRTGNTLNITFHNPNSSDETAKLLIRVIAENMSESVINQSVLYFNNKEVTEYIAKGSCL